MSQGTQPRVGVRLIMVAALAGLVAGVGLVLVTSRVSTSSEPDLASMDQIQLSEAPDPVAPPPPEASAQPAPESEPAPDGESAPDAVASVDTCVRAATLAASAVDAARTSLGNWKTHYGAQIAFDEGEIDSAEATRRWAESKEPAERNIDAFVEARDAMTGEDACADLDGDQLDGEELQQMQSCAARTAAASEVMTDAQPALDDWLDHLEMMATKDQYTLDEYLAIWRRAVADAPAAMSTFESAVQAYEESGDCPTDRAAARAPLATPVAAVATPVGADPVLTCVLTRDRARQPTANA